VPLGPTILKIWSEYKDSNLGPSAPKADALPGCATLRINTSYALVGHHVDDADLPSHVVDNVYDLCRHSNIES
jgi:hypothetical protein